MHRYFLRGPRQGFGSLGLNIASQRKPCSDKPKSDMLDWLQSLKHFFHQCVISYTCSQSNSDGSVLRAIRVRLATSI